MKNKILHLVILILIAACEQTESLKENIVKEEVENPLLGEWQLQEILIDPGDGSGNYEAVSSVKTITFFSNDSIYSNGDLCDLSTVNYNPTSGIYLIYSLEEGLLSIPQCHGTETTFEIPYTLKEELTLRYPCIEPCEMRFVKIN